MKFTRDICRLLGFGGGGPCEEEEAVVQDGAPDPKERRTNQDPLQSTGNSEEDLDEEERSKRRAEKRRAKKKRQKERRKLERKERVEDASAQEEEASGAVSESDGDEDLKEEEQWTAVRPRHKWNHESVPALSTTETRSNHKLPRRTSEEEEGLDISSAFVVNAASNIKLKGLKSRALQISRDINDTDAMNGQVEISEEMKRAGQSLAEQGVQLFDQGEYTQAVDMFTQAIFCDRTDYRFYGNRSYCYWFLQQNSAALNDAQRSIQLAPDWPMGYFRKACALMELQRNSEAEEALEQVLKLEPQCKEASDKLFTCHCLQLMEMGFDEEQSKELLERFTTIQAVITSLEAKTLKLTPLLDQDGCRSLWVGNITMEVTEKHLWDLFKMFGEIESIRVIYESFCAFINFKNANMAAKALEKLQGVELGGRKLVMRYPDRWFERNLPSLPRTNTTLSSSAGGTQLYTTAAGNLSVCLHAGTDGGPPSMERSVSTGEPQAASMVTNVTSNTHQSCKVETRNHDILDNAPYLINYYKERTSWQ
ncbi:stress-induced-phosphoprotein 1-like isoform X2 [Parambassis ranga]|uniref:Stress-induced-phosphoprotein 1-like isoform X2 n=1 Tax=Parambassis ranga TaxID=210632 RepID=A0A6P7IT88_9TELE|nr:stress-induced-phosphoprotein 1-like isoform X2 [Parambassis ranga]